MVIIELKKSRTANHSKVVGKNKVLSIRVAPIAKSKKEFHKRFISFLLI